VTTSETETDATGDEPAWGDEGVVLQAVRSQDEARPAFPDEVSGYSLDDEDRATLRVFTGGKQWQTLEDFPATMNGCDEQRFHVRWRSLDPTADVEATWLNYDGSVENKAVRGSAGWQSSFGCSQPAFRLHSSGNGSTLTDVVVDVQRWEASS
jgi:hypothetical protein